jgi:putative redox protein
MNLKMKWQGEKTFSGINDAGTVIKASDITSFNVPNQGVSPTEMLLGSIIGCTGINMVSILEKMRLHATSIQIEATGKQAESHPRRLTKVHIHVEIEGNISEQELNRTLELTLNKYCSVVCSLNAEITASYTLNHNHKVNMDLN